MASAMIRFENVSRHFDTKIAVDNLSMEINAGEVFAFLGPNGAGKTTSLKMLVGLLVPSSGSVFIDGIDVVRSARQAKALLGFVPDQPELYDKLSGREMKDGIVFTHAAADGATSNPRRIGSRVKPQPPCSVGRAIDRMRGRPVDAVRSISVLAGSAASLTRE